jgi:O-antigen ligase
VEPKTQAVAWPAPLPGRALLLKPGLRLCETGLLVHAAFVPISIAGMQIGLGIAALGIVLAAAGGSRLRRTPLDLPLAALVVVALASDALSPYGFPSLSFATLWRSVAGFWIVANGLSILRDPPRRANELLLAAAAGLAASALVGIAQYGTGLDVLHFVGLRSEHALVEAPGVPGHFGAMGFFTSRLTFGHNASVLCALLLGACAAGALKGRARIFALGASLLGLAAVTLTFDRAAYLGLIAAVATLLIALPGDPRKARKRRLSFALGLALTLVAAGALPGVRARFASGFDLRGNSDRVFLWSRAREIVRDHPLSGVGFGNYPRVCGAYYDRVDPAFPMRTWAHNSPLSLLAETGPLGLFAGGAVALAALAALLRRLRRDPHGLALGGLGALVTLFAIAQAHDVLYDTKVMYALWLALGVALFPEAAPSPQGRAVPGVQTGSAVQAGPA